MTEERNYFDHVEMSVLPQGTDFYDQNKPPNSQTSYDAEDQQPWLMRMQEKSNEVWLENRV